MGRSLFTVISLILAPLLALSQSVTTEYGKNRIQFHDDFDKWDMYETENFVTYWYGKGREIAHTVVQMAELDNPAIERILEHKMNDKIELIVYLDLSDLKQSNLGIEDQFVNKSGITKVIENKVFLYFNGDHNALRKSLREGIASVYINSMLHGNNLQEIVQNAVLLNLPDWFQEGLVAYVGEDWSPETDSRLKDYFTNPKKKHKDFARLAKENPSLAGHAMWNFISATYGKSTISNILYLTRINRSLESGFIYVLGFNSKELAAQWQAFYEQRYLKSNIPESFIQNNLALFKQRRNIPLGRLRLSPDAKQLAYTLNDNGRVRVMLYDMVSGEKKVLFRYGVKNFEQEADLNYPVIAWRQDGKELSIMYERRDVAHLMKYDFEHETVFTDKLSPEYHRIYDMDYWSADTLMINGSIDGFSDLYLYAPITRQSVRVTNDFYDDLDASVISLGGKRYILFSSNRPDESIKKMGLDSMLPIGPLDLFLLNYSKESSSLRQLTFTPAYSERKARISGDDELISLTDIDGRWQRIRISRLSEDPPVSTVQARYDRDIRLHEYVPGSREVIDWFQKWNLPFIYAHPLDSLSMEYPIERVLPHFIQADSVHTNAQPEHKAAEIDPGYLFQTPYPVPPPPAIKVIKDDSTLDIKNPADEITQFTPAPTKSKMSYDPSKLTPFIHSQVIAARLRFKLDYFNTTLNNDVLFGGLDSYAGTKREFEPSPLGILVKASIKDLLEDYVLTGGVRFPTTFNGSEYFLVFNNRKRRWDKEFALYRKSVTEYDPTEEIPTHRNQFVTVLGIAKFSYPFDVYNSARVSFTLRNDKTIALATDHISLDEKTDDAQRAGVKLEWIFDNTRTIDVNSMLGTRAKFSAEAVKRFDLNLFESDEKFQFNEGFMSVLSMDARHYVSPDRRTIFAGRLTAATTFGSERILYYLGGVENWLFPSYDNTVSVPSDGNFAYTSIAANMRGFKYNARNGSSVVLVNLEARVPFLQYLSRQKIRSSFLRNFQAVGFIDAGTAWHGKDPFGPKNPLNTVVLTNPPTVEVTVNYYRNPLIVGYGVGIRTMIFSYFAKLDYGWNWETKTNRNPILHFSLGADF
ncbi:MAG TPA: hypothetical protein VFF90_07905 [Saprospiraceae bacterium]|nr:hypothetical protein [Saprospiraceae bacterium]